MPPPSLTANFSNILRFGVVFRVETIFVFVSDIKFAISLVADAIPDRWLKKFKAVLSALRIEVAFPFTDAIISPFLTFEPLSTFFLKLNRLSRVIKDNSATCNPEITPSDRDFKTKLFSKFLSITELLVISPCWPRSS